MVDINQIWKIVSARHIKAGFIGNQGQMKAPDHKNYEYKWRRNRLGFCRLSELGRKHG